MNISIDKKSLEDHVDSICRRNLGSQKPKKICSACLIIGPVLEIMADKNYTVQPWVDSAKHLNSGFEHNASGFYLCVDQSELKLYITQFCRSNIRQGIKICNRCPIKDYVAEIGSNMGWKSFENYLSGKSESD